MRTVLERLGFRWRSRAAGKLRELARATRQTEHELRRGRRPFPIGEATPVGVQHYLRHPREFENPLAPEVRPVDATSLWPLGGRLTVVDVWFPVFGTACVVRRGDPALSTTAAADVIVARRDALRALVPMHPSPPRRALISLTELGGLPLSGCDRDWLWEAWGVPVYEQVRGLDGELLAWECEAHSGLHVAAEHSLWECRGGELLVTSLENLRYPALRLATGWRGRLVESTCGCGREGVRIVEFEPSLAAAAASA